LCLIGLIWNNLVTTTKRDIILKDAMQASAKVNVNNSHEESLMAWI